MRSSEMLYDPDDEPAECDGQPFTERRATLVPLLRTGLAASIERASDAPRRGPLRGLHRGERPGRRRRIRHREASDVVYSTQASELFADRPDVSGVALQRRRRVVVVPRDFVRPCQRRARSSRRAPFRGSAPVRDRPSSTIRRRPARRRAQRGVGRARLRPASPIDVFVGRASTDPLPTTRPMLLDASASSQRRTSCWQTTNGILWGG